jgi:hypothetical protein
MSRDLEKPFGFDDVPGGCGFLIDLLARVHPEIAMNQQTVLLILQ